MHEHRRERFVGMTDGSEAQRLSSLIRTLSVSASAASNERKKSIARCNPVITGRKTSALLQPFDPQRVETPLMLKIKILFLRDTLRLLCISNLAFSVRLHVGFISETKE